MYKRQALYDVTENKWQDTELTEIAALTHIRIEPATKLVTDKQNRQITISATLFYDCRNSRPLDVQFAQGQKLQSGGIEYTVETIEMLYDEGKLHHLEVGLA